VKSVFATLELLLDAAQEAQDMARAHAQSVMAACDAMKSGAADPTTNEAWVDHMRHAAFHRARMEAKLIELDKHFARVLDGHAGRDN
jgi:hypothetical protein